MKYQDFIKLVSSRTSCRNYSSKDVSVDVIEKCIEAARLSPSACNKQPWKFIVIKDNNTRENIFTKGLLPCLTMPWFQTAPVIIIMCAESTFITHKLAPKISGIDYRLVDLGIAGEHFVLAAESMGLGSCWIGWFKEKKVKQILNIPKNIKIVSLLTLGYPAKQDKKFTEKLPLDKITYYESWGNTK